jgi:hypothetical protein
LTAGRDLPENRLLFTSHCEMKAMKNWRSGLFLMTVLAFVSSTGLVAQETVSKLQDWIGARGAATDQLGERGFTYVRTEKSEDSSYTYWTETSTNRCVIARVSGGKIASIVYAPSSDCGPAAASANAGEGFATVCGVIEEGKTHRYRCQAEETMSSEGHEVTILRYPDIEIKLHWHQLGVEMEGMEPVQTTYSTREGETNFVVEGKTYFFIADKRAAKREVENFRD